MVKFWRDVKDEPEEYKYFVVVSTVYYDPDQLLKSSASVSVLIKSSLKLACEHVNNNIDKHANTGKFVYIMQVKDSHSIKDVEIIASSLAQHAIRVVDIGCYGQIAQYIYHTDEIFWAMRQTEHNQVRSRSCVLV